MKGKDTGFPERSGYQHQENSFPGHSQKFKHSECLTFGRPTFIQLPLNVLLNRTEKRAEKKLVDGLAEGVVDTTQKATQKIIEAIAKKSDITQKELAVVIGITEDGVKYHITRLRKKGVIKRIGPDKGGHWEIVNV
ncbi:MAG: winged helix-turn-helix transcriptional regulator [Planctomycetes bacterium]|nr:winged helix-turn-helix transcriptional regulator [Planctomycetota bacterium]